MSNTEKWQPFLKLGSYPPVLQGYTQQRVGDYIVTVCLHTGRRHYTRMDPDKPETFDESGHKLATDKLD